MQIENMTRDPITVRLGGVDYAVDPGVSEVEAVVGSHACRVFFGKIRQVQIKSAAAPVKSAAAPAGVKDKLKAAAKSLGKKKKKSRR